jgi:hypothetical protein
LNSKNELILFFLNRFEDIGSANGLEDEEDEEDDNQSSESDGIIRSTRKKKAPREHVCKRKISI